MLVFLGSIQIVFARKFNSLSRTHVRSGAAFFRRKILYFQAQNPSFTDAKSIPNKSRTKEKKTVVLNEINLKFHPTIIVFSQVHSLYCACVSWEHTDSNCKEVQFSTSYPRSFWHPRSFWLSIFRRKILYIQAQNPSFSDTKSIPNNS